MIESIPKRDGAAEPPAASQLVTVAYDDARDNRALTAGIAGTGIALLTFALIFLFDRWRSGSVNDLAFECSLLVIVTSVFFVGLSSMNFWFTMEALRSSHPSPEIYQRRAEALFGTSWILLLLEPALILAAVKLYLLAVVAGSLWLVTVLLLISGWRDARRTPSKKIA